MSMYPETNVENLITEESDHMAILIHVLETAPGARSSVARPSQFEEMWTRHEGYDAMVTNAWAEAGRYVNGAGVCSKLHHLTRSMQAWGRTVFGSIRRQLAMLKDQLRDAKERGLVTGYTQEVRDVEGQLKEIYEREEIMQKQRSRVGWLKEGDRSKRNWQSNKIPLSLIGLVWSCLVHATVRWFGLDRANRAFFRYPIASWGVLENSIVFNY